MPGVLLGAGSISGCSSIAVPTQSWRVVVTKLGGSDIVGEVEVDAANWMGALRIGRERLGEASAMPAGASCSVDGAGVATILDPAARRKLVLTPLGPSTNASAPPPNASASPAPAQAPAAAPASHAPAAVAATPAQPPAAAHVTSDSQAAPPAKKRKRLPN